MKDKSRRRSSESQGKTKDAPFLVMYQYKPGPMMSQKPPAYDQKLSSRKMTSFFSFGSACPSLRAPACFSTPLNRRNVKSSGAPHWSC